MKLKIGVLGAGHLGKIHLKLIKEIETYTLVGFYDSDVEQAQQVAKELNITAFPTAEQLINSVDVVDIVTPTIAHFKCAKMAIQAGKHLFIEKPLANTLDEAKQLVELVANANIKAQVGHVERFNPAFLALKDKTLQPLFIETHRLAQFNPRGTDVSVVLDLMIHDLDIILSLVAAEVSQVQASGVAILSDTPDIANARIEFDNGCVANVTASRLSLKNMRKMRIFQRDAYVSIDFLEKKTEIIQLSDTQPNQQAFFKLNVNPKHTSKYITFEHPEILPINAIKKELELLAQSIIHQSAVAVSVQDGYNALKLAYKIAGKITKQLQIY